MKKSDFFRMGFVPQGVLGASAIIAVLSLIGFVMAPIAVDEQASMRINSEARQVSVGETFTADVVVDAKIPVNVFRGEVRFDPARMKVESIDYNTSIADLWAELPWYENGEGAINFTGGTTVKGGFQGSGSLITITFRTLDQGATSLRLEGARILEHNGLGTDVALTTPIDALFEVEEHVIASQTVAEPEDTTTALVVVSTPPSTDLNGDGKQSLADVSIFVLNMFTDEARYDFNEDGKVDTKDMSILMSKK